MLAGVSYPQGGLPREFRMGGGGFGRMVLPFVIVLVFFAAVMLLLFSIFFGLLGGIIAAIVGPLALLGVLYGKFARMKSGTVVRFSEQGVELSDAKGFHMRLAWPDITRIGRVDTQMANPGAIGEQGGVQVAVGAMQSQGIIGWGQRVIPPNAPGWMRENLAAQPKNPVDGRPEVAIPLGGIDPNWLHGPMGAWIRQYRPDLLGGAPGYGTGGHQPPGYPAAGQPGPPGQPGHPPAGQPGYPQQGGYPAPPPGPPGYPPSGHPYPPR
jgi:hypothetical protein